MLRPQLSKLFPQPLDLDLLILEGLVQRDRLKLRVLGVVLLRLPQNDPEALLRSFAPLLAWPPAEFSGKLLPLSSEGREALPLKAERTQ